jgi:PRTRC genetic system ThiF family protein
VKIIHAFNDTRGQYVNRGLRILLIGSGGTGSAVLFALPDLHNALIAWGAESGLHVIVMDADTVSPTNCVRQPFGGSDIGLNKATVLVNRLNMFHQLDWEARAEYFTPEREPSSTSFDRTIDFVISCVDTRSARRAMHEAFTTRTGPWRNVSYWLDIGNNADNGQFVLGQPRNCCNKPSSTRLRTVAELYPSIMDTSAGEDDLPSCSAAEALTRQEPMTNKVLAMSALAMLTQLIHHGEVNHQGAFWNAKSGRSEPIAIDPEVWKKSLNRRRRTVHKTTSLALAA